MLQFTHRAERHLQRSKLGDPTGNVQSFKFKAFHLRSDTASQECIISYSKIRGDNSIIPSKHVQRMWSCHNYIMIFRVGISSGFNKVFPEVTHSWGKSSGKDRHGTCQPFQFPPRGSKQKEGPRVLDLMLGNPQCTSHPVGGEPALPQQHHQQWPENEGSNFTEHSFISKSVETDSHIFPKK